MERDPSTMDRWRLRSDTDRCGFKNLPLECVNLEAKGGALAQHAGSPGLNPRHSMNQVAHACNSSTHEEDQILKGSLNYIRLCQKIFLLLCCYCFKSKCYCVTFFGPLL